MPEAAGFAQHFRAHVAPRVRHCCRLHGLRVAAGEESYGQAYDEAVYLAVRLGASHLPPLLWDDLQNVIGQWLADVIADALPVAEEAERVAERVAVDLARYFRSLP